MNRFEIQKAAVERAIAENIENYKAIYKTASDENRDPDDSERLEIEKHLRNIETLKEERASAQANIDQLKHVEELSESLGKNATGDGGGLPIQDVSTLRVGHTGADRMLNAVGKSIGEAFVSSEGYRKAIDEYKDNGGRFREGFSIPSVSSGLEMKGTLLEGPGGGGGVVAATVPQVVPGVVEKLFQRLTVSDLLLSGQASTNSLRYVVEGTATSGAAGVAEAGTKPESAVGFTVTDEPIKKIATMLPVSEEMLEDAPAIQSYINGRLTLFVKIEEERQLIRGTQGGNEVQGLLTSRGIPVYAGGTAVGNRAVQLFKAMNGMRGSAFVEPDWTIMNPADWEAIRLMQDTAGQFYGGGPFQGQYGNGANLDASNQLVGSDTVWNKPVFVTSAIGAGTALVGSRSAAQVWRRGGLNVDASNSHSNFFAINLVAIRAEERIGLAVYRPAGFVEVRLS
jgi:HK97 family phage major capsid protein